MKHAVTRMTNINNEMHAVQITTDNNLCCIFQLQNEQTATKMHTHIKIHYTCTNLCTTNY